MTAGVYRGQIQGNNTNHVVEFYHNTTGGNVRIVWYYVHFGDTYPAGCNMWVGTTAPTTDSSPGDATTLKLDSLGNSNFHTGKYLGRYAANSYTSDGAGGASGAFPCELVLAAGDKMWIYIPSQANDSSHNYAIKYNFLEIPEV